MQSYAESLAQQINARKIEFIYFQAPISCLGNLISASLVLMFYWALLPHAALITWAAFTTMLMLERWSSSTAFSKRDRYADISPWYRRYNVNVIFNGFAWGILFLLAATMLPANQLVVMVTVLGALISATSIAYHGYLRLYLNFAAPAFIPAGAFLVWRATPTEMALGAAALCWLALMLSFARQINQALSKSSSYEFSNVALLRELTEQREKSMMLQEEVELKQRIIQNLMLNRAQGVG